MPSESSFPSLLRALLVQACTSLLILVCLLRSLTPEIKRYLANFAKGFVGGLQTDTGCRVSFMQSDGSLVDFRSFSGLRAILCTSLVVVPPPLRSFFVFRSWPCWRSRWIRSDFLRRGGRSSCSGFRHGVSIRPDISSLEGLRTSAKLERCLSSPEQWS